MKYKIYNENGLICKNQYEIVGNTSIKNIVKIKNCKTGESRLVHKDRIIKIEGKVEMKKTEKKEEKVEKVEKVVKKAEKVVKVEKMSVFDVKKLSGIIFKSSKDKFMEVGENKILIESYCMVSKDGKQLKYFNLYDGSLGKKGKDPVFGENDNVKSELSGNIGSIEKFLNKKGYLKI